MTKEERILKERQEIMRVISSEQNADEPNTLKLVCLGTLQQENVRYLETIGYSVQEADTKKAPVMRGGKTLKAFCIIKK